MIYFDAYILSLLEQFDFVRDLKHITMDRSYFKEATLAQHTENLRKLLKMHGFSINVDLSGWQEEVTDIKILDEPITTDRYSHPGPMYNTIEKESIISSFVC